MTLRQIPWKWLLLGLAGLTFIALALLPRQIGDSSPLAQRAAQKLSAWTGGEIQLTGPLRIHYFPDVAIKGGFQLGNASRFPLVQSIAAPEAKISLDLAELLLGRMRVNALRLDNPVIKLKKAPSLVMGPDQTLQARMLNLLGAAPVGMVRLRGGTIHIPNGAGEEILRKVNARLDASSRDGAVWTFGSFVLRDETVGFSLHSGVPAQTADGVAVPIDLTLTSAPVVAKFHGTASFANRLRLDGELGADMDSARSFLSWAGIPLPPGRSLQALSVAGRVHWNGTTLTFDDGAFTLDENSAVGLFAITPGARPRLEGTLDFERLALDAYLGTGSGSEPAAAQGSLSDQALLKFFDADLRVSAAEIAVTPVPLGRGGFTVSAKEGLIATEIGELELCGGQATGRMEIDVRRPAAKATLAARLFDLPVEICLKALHADLPLNGFGALMAELESEGSSYEDLLRETAGSLRLSALNGTVPVDFARLFAVAAPSADGWSRQSVTPFDQFKADCRLAAGQIWCDSFNMETRSGLISGSGSVDLAQQAIDWSLFLASHAQPLKASQLSTAMPPRITITGPLAQPTIRRADGPSFGDSSMRTNPAANQISPR